MVTNIEDDEEQGGKGGKTGDIEFRYRDILASEPRDDTLPIEEINRLLSVHESLHKGRVDHQKATRKERDEIKKNPNKTPGYDSLGYARGGGESAYKTHPLSSYAQFSGATDKKITGVPCDNIAQTNDEQKQKLIAQLNLRFQHKNVPKFTAPTLRRY